MKMGPLPDCLKAMGAVKVTRETMIARRAEKEAVWAVERAAEKERLKNAPKVVYKYDPEKDVRCTNE